MSRREVRIAPGGAREPRPTGCGGRMGRTGSFAPTHLVIARQSADWRGHWLGMTARRCRADGTSGTPSPTHLVIASQSAPRSKCPWGTDWRGNPFPSARPPLDKPAGMGIIINRRGRCDKRSAPLRENFNEPYGSQKPSPCRVAVFVFQLHNTNRNGIPPDVESKYPVHVCHPLSGL